MKLTINETTQREVNIKLPYYSTYKGWMFYKVINENTAIVVNPSGMYPSIGASVPGGAFNKECHEIDAVDFYMAYARAEHNLRELSGVELLPLISNDPLDTCDDVEGVDMEVKNEMEHINYIQSIS